MGMVDDEDDDEEKEEEEKGTRKWRRTTTKFSLIVLKCFNNQLRFPPIR